MTAMSNQYAIQEVANVTGLDECEIRFFEQVFREFLAFSRPDPDRNVFSQDHVDILSRIRELIHVRGQSIDEVKLELKDVLNRSDSPQDIFQPVEGNIKESAL